MRKYQLETSICVHQCQISVCSVHQFLLQQVVELMSKTIADISEAEFSELKDKDGNGRIPAAIPTQKDWENQTFLSTGNPIH